MGKYETSIKTRQALINAAGELAAEQGIGAVTLRAIARRAGENVGSIHYHFGSKDNLLEAVINSVVERWLERPLAEIVQHADLITAAGKARTIRRIVERDAQLLFDRSAPNWHSGVVYQVLQYATPLQERLRERLLGPELEQMVRLFQALLPGIDEQEAQLHYFLMLTPLLFHVDYKNVLLSKLQREDYSDAYIERLTGLCVRQALLLLNLPLAES